MLRPIHLFRPSQVAFGIERVKAALPRLLMLAQGGTAVGTGLNSVEGFDVRIAEEIARVRATPAAAAAAAARFSEGRSAV
jgi:fumarate hydratase class II